jgi:hypothetical protein
VTDQHSTRPVEKFLGQSAAAGGPFALLGLAPEDCTQELIIVQLQRQLKRLLAHPDAATHAADEVRLALHAAAAQLLEGVARDSRQASDAASQPPLAPPSFSGSRASASPGGLSPGQLAMEQDIIATIAQYGGWNSQCMHRLGLLAHSRGVSQEEFLGAIDAFRRTPASHQAGAGESFTSANQGASPEPPAIGVPEEVDPTPRVILAGTIAIVLVLALLGGAIYLIASLTGARSTPVTGVVAGASAPEGGPPGDGPSRPSQLFPSLGPGQAVDSGEAAPPTPGAAIDVASLIREMRSAIELTSSDRPAAHARFLGLIDAAKATWIRATPDQITAIQDAVVEYVYRTRGASDEGRATLLACVAGVREVPGSGLTAEQIRAAAFSAGLVARLSRERELPVEISNLLSTLVRDDFFRALSVGDASFRGGATSACVELARRLTPDAAVTPSNSGTTESWQAWLECVQALGLEGSARNRLVLQALDATMRDGPEPSRSKPAFDSITALASSFTWLAKEESRGRLLRWFDDSGVSSPDLHALTLAIAAKGLAVGVDSSMVLSAGAGDAERSGLRDRFKEAWGDSTLPSRALASQQLIQAAQSALGQGPAPDPSQRLVSAVWYSRLSEAAEAVWLGVSPPPTQEAPRLSSITPATQSSGSFVYASVEVSNSSWAVQYLAARSRIPERLQLLSTYIPSTDGMLAIEASILVSEAIRGSPYEVRRAAASIVRAQAAAPAFVNAFLDQCSTMPLTRENSALASSVSRGGMVSLRSPSFRVVLRRSLVERLLELLSGTEDLALVDALSAHLTESYQRRAKRAVDALGRDPNVAADAEEEEVEAEPDDSRTPALPPLERSATTMRLAMDDEARRHLPSGRELATLDEIRHDRSSRLRAAAGRPQQFAAEQASLVDLMAYMVVAESPSQVAAVAEVLQEYSSARRNATHITQQVESGERAMLRLWLLRLTGEGL